MQTSTKRKAYTTANTPNAKMPRINTTNYSQGISDSQESLDPRLLNEDAADNLTQQVLEKIPALNNDDGFEEFTQQTLKLQLDTLKSVHEINVTITKLSEEVRGQLKGGGPIEDFKNIFRGFIYTVFSERIRSISKKVKTRRDYVTEFCKSYFDKLKSIVDTDNYDPENLAQLIYGLSAISAVYYSGLMDYTLLFANYILPILINVPYQILPILKSVLSFTPACLGATALYRYRSIPMGAYGVYSSITSPVLTALWREGDQTIQRLFPELSQTSKDMLKDQLNAFQATKEQIMNKFKELYNTTSASMKPLIDALKRQKTNWHNATINAIKEMIKGGKLLRKDVNDVVSYITFLKNVGENVRSRVNKESNASIADLLPSDDDVALGAAIIGILHNDIDTQITAEDAATTLLLLSNSSENISPPEINIDEACMLVFNGGKRHHKKGHKKKLIKAHKKTKRANKSKRRKGHKTKATKKGHNAKKTKVKKAKKGKKYTKKRSYKGGMCGCEK